MQAYLYNTFSEIPFGGNVAWIVPQADTLSVQQMQAIATEFAAPATAFLLDASGASPEIRFFSPTAEFSMCGHAIVGAMCALVDSGFVSIERCATATRQLRAAPGEIPVALKILDNDRPHCVMTQPKPWFESTAVTSGRIASLLGLREQDMDETLPIEMGSTGLKHVFVPLKTSDSLRVIEADFDGLAALSMELNVESVAVFTLDTGDSARQVRGRDFCPAIGVPEEAASGTTNGAIASYLVRHDRLPVENDGRVFVTAEQGVEMGRPSLVHTEIQTDGPDIVAVKVGGTATRLISGRLNLAG